MFGAINKTITEIYSPTKSEYAADVLGDPKSVEIDCWFEKTFQSIRNAAGDNFLADAKAFLAHDSGIEEGKIITIGAQKWKVVSDSILEDFDGNERTELLLKKTSRT